MSQKSKVDKKVLAKTLLTLTAITLSFGLLAIYLQSGSQNLLEYAEEKNSLTEDNPNNTHSSPPVFIVEKQHSTPENPERVTYQKDFYYEPLSEETKEFITGVSFPTDDSIKISYEDLAYVHVLHVDFEGNSQIGELICNKAIAQDFVEIFYDLYMAKYPIERMYLVENYDGDDELSMQDNNTSCFNYRNISGTSQISEHAYGLAIDINPFYNPCVTTQGGKKRVAPKGSEAYSDRSLSLPYMITKTDLCYQLFIEHGFTWGGNWKSSKDYQHFEKKLN